MRTAYILMGDVVGSRQRHAVSLATSLQELVDKANKTHQGQILSPLTVTLGDEFQGIVKDLRSAVELIFFLEEEIRRTGESGIVSLRHVLHKGEIETPLNRKVAHGMLGPGLTHARELLTQRARGKPKFTVSLGESSATSWLSRLFALVESVQRGWAPRDDKLVARMIEEPNDLRVGEVFDKNRSQIYKRRRTLRIEDYRILRSLIKEFSEGLPPDSFKT